MMQTGDVHERVSESALRSHLCYLMRSASIELTTREAMDIAAYDPYLSRGMRVYIPHASTIRILDMVAAARTIASVGLVPVPHIAARRLSSEIEFRYLAEQFREAGCTEALVIGGGVKQPAGPYANSMDLLRSGVLETAGFRRIGIAAHPEGCPDVPDSVLRDAFIAKGRFAEEARFKMYALTQFCFNTESILRWERDFRDLADHLPVHVGLPGVTSGAKLLRFAALCGVRASAEFLRQGIPRLGRLLVNWSPGNLIVNIASRTLGDPNCMIRQLHFFPFGGLHGTVAWMRAIGEGRFTLSAGVDGFAIAIDESAL